jgi:5-methylcytosine-specific restriction enzyme subunit McrC
MIDSHCQLEEEQTWYDRLNRVLYMKEYEKRVVREMDEPFFAELCNFSGRSELIDFEELITEGERCLVFKASCLVGVEKIGDYTVFVSPKVNYADFFTMVNYAYDFNIDLKDDRVYLEQTYGNLTAIFLKYIIMSLRVFVAKDLKRSFVRKEEDLTSKIKGRVMLSSYLKKSVPAKKDSTIPCQFHEIQVDCLENQIIRYTIEMAKVVIQSRVFSLPLRRELIDECNKILQRLGMVSFRRIELGDFNRVRYVGRFKEYRQPHQLCQLFMEAAKLEMKSGKFSFKGFHLDMNELFEKFVAGVLKKEAGLKVDIQEKGGFSIDGYAKYICLDGWLNEEGFVFDTKYKEVFEPTKDREATTIGAIKVLNADIYQILAYCNHNKFSGASGILVYPIAFATDDDNRTYLVRGFNRDIYLTSINLQFNYVEGKPMEIVEFAERFKDIITASTAPDKALAR